MDLIGRNEAISAVKDALLAWSYMPEWRDDKIVASLMELPSVRPNVIQCEQCKHYEWDEANDAYHCMEWGYNFPEEDDFCSRAERREDG